MDPVKASVVVLARGDEERLAECLDGLVGQTLREIEIVCVDDGSSDSAAAVLARRAERDPRIVVLRQEGGGPGAAGNAGLRAAKGEYVAFLEAGDVFGPTLLEKACAKAKSAGKREREREREKGTDVALFGGRLRGEDGEEPAPWLLKRGLLPAKEVFCRKDVPDALLTLTAPCLWNKLFRREFLLEKGIEFPPTRRGDVCFSLVALALAETIACVDADLVCRRIDRDEDGSSAPDAEPELVLEAYEAAYDALNRAGVYKEVEKSFAEAAIRHCGRLLDGLERRPESRLKLYKALTEPSFARMGLLDRPIDWYGDEKRAIQLLGAKHVVEWDERLNRAPQDDFRTLTRSGTESPLVSVIVPVYDTAPYLEACLDSVRNQTLKRIEIVCVNDGSTDGSLEILRKYAEEDGRIALGTQANRGLSATRNKGAAQARGKYLYFMDSDDLLEPSALETLYERAEADGLDVLCFDGDSFATDPGYEKAAAGYADAYKRKFRYDGVRDGTALLREMARHKEYRTVVWLQFIKRDHYVRNGLSFPEGIIHEDNLFTYECLLRAGRAGHLPAALFHRRVRPDSIMTRRISFANAYGYFICYLEMKRLYEERTTPSGSKDEMLFAPVEGALRGCRSSYRRLSPEERQAVLALPDDRRRLFEALVVAACDAKLKARWARFVREARGRARRLKEDGIVYSAKSFFRRVAKST